MLIRELDYQNEALFGCESEGQEGLINISNRLLKANLGKKPPEVILKAITGAGKTVIMANYMKELVKLEDRPKLVFVWLSIGAGGLQFQSAKKITPLLANTGIKVICPEDEKDFNVHSFKDKNLLILNWEKINNTKNDELVSNLMIGETHNLKKAVQKTDKNIKFIVMVDEFHKNYQTYAYNLIMKLFNPKFILGMTATPTKVQMTNKNSFHYVPTSKVRESGMIKKGTIFNQDCNQIILDDSGKFGLEEAILKKAMEKRCELEEKFKNENSNIIPLCLIQVPNNDKEFLETIKLFLSCQLENGKKLKEDEDYTCWLTDSTKNNDIIESLETNNIKYLIFKQAIATGWDCPRAHVLVKYRPLKKELEAFDLQTIGRILRTPERKHYENEDELNYAFIYAPEKRFTFDKEVEDALGNPEVNNKEIKYIDDIQLVEEVIKSEKIKITYPNFDEIKNIFIKNLEDKYNQSTADNDFSKVHIFNTKIKHTEEMFNGQTDDLDIEDNIIIYNSTQISRVFNTFLKGLKRKYLSKNDIKAILFDFFKKYINTELSDEEALLKKIELCLTFREAITKAVLATSQEVSVITNRKRDGVGEFKISRNPKYLVEDTINCYKKCLYSPCAEHNLSEPEIIFIQELEKNKNVKWWYKNLEKSRESLSIIYIEEEGRTRGKQYQIIAPTYPDFIVFFEEANDDNIDISLGIYEIKDKDKVENVNDRKHIAIKEYIEKLSKSNNNFKNIYGGVVKISNYHSLYEDDSIMGDIYELDKYPELKYNN